jgi:hypothetical protein
MRVALRVLVDGSVEELDLDSAEGSLKVLQNGVKFDENDVYPLVQAIDIDSEKEGMTLWVHEEGKLLGHPRNDAGSIMYEAVFGHGLDTIVGNVVFTGKADEEGETMGLPENYQRGVRRLAYTIWDINNN